MSLNYSDSRLQIAVLAPPFWAIEDASSEISYYFDQNHIHVEVYFKTTHRKSSLMIQISHSISYRSF